MTVDLCAGPVEILAGDGVNWQMPGKSFKVLAFGFAPLIR
jgi:hypothetical protein